MTPPRFAHGELRLLLLALIAEQPRHGYELMQALTDRFAGTYAPSAGTIYPRLAKLEEEGLITHLDEARRTIYTATDRGREEVASRQRELDAIGLDAGSVRSQAEATRSSMASSAADLRRSFPETPSKPTRTYPTPHPRTEPTPPPERASIARVDAILAEFRSQMRMLARERDGVTSESDARVLEARLHAVADEFAEALKPQNP